MKISKSALMLIFGLTVLSILSVYSESVTEKNSKIFDVRDFTSIINRTRADLVIHLGKDWKVEAQGNKRGVQNLKIFNRNGELVIRSKLSIFLFGRIIYRPVLISIYMPQWDLEALTVTGLGDANIIGDLRSKNTTLKTTARGSISAVGNVERLTLLSSASGGIAFTGHSQVLDVKLSASGDTNLKVQTDNIKAKISSSGSIYISGEARNSEIQLTARGNFVGRDFSSDYANIRISGSGDAELRIESEMDVRLTAQGNLYYWGNPQAGETILTGRGRLEGRE